MDGSHHARDVLQDAVLAWGLLRPGGYMIFDDYEWVSDTFSNGTEYGDSSSGSGSDSDSGSDNDSDSESGSGGSSGSGSGLSFPKMAVDAFLSVMAEELEVLHKEYQVFVRKRRPVTTVRASP